MIDRLKPILENPAADIVNQNIKYDMLVLHKAGIELGGIGVDPMVGDYLLDAAPVSRPRHAGGKISAAPDDSHQRALSGSDSGKSRCSTSIS